MENLKKEFLDKLGEKISNSEYFKSLNKNAKKIFEEKNMTLTQEQYQALRGVFVSKTILEDEEIFKMVSQEVWENLQNNDEFMNSIKE